MYSGPPPSPLSTNRSWRPSGVSCVSRERSSHERSRSPSSSRRRKYVSWRMVVRSMRTRPSGAMSCRMRRPSAGATMRCRRSSVTACSALSAPIFEAREPDLAPVGRPGQALRAGPVRQTAWCARPCGRPRPRRRGRRRASDARGTPRGRAAGDRRTCVGRTASQSTVPTGYSMRRRAPVPRTTAKSPPSDAQSAHRTSSSTSLTGPPAIGTRASVAYSPPLRSRSSAMNATSPDVETPTSRGPAAGMGRGSRRSSRTVNTESGRPSNAAL